MRISGIIFICLIGFSMTRAAEREEFVIGDLIRGARDLVIPEAADETFTGSIPTIEGRNLFGDCSNNKQYCSALQCAQCGEREWCKPVECDCTYICYSKSITLKEAVPRQDMNVVSKYKNLDSHYGHTQWQEPEVQKTEIAYTFYGDLSRGAGDLVIPDIYSETDNRTVQMITGRKIYGNCSINALFCSTPQCAYCKMGEQCTPVECDCTYICYDSMTLLEAVPREDGNVISTYRNIGGHYGHTQQQQPGSEPIQLITNAFHGDLFRGEGDLVIPEIYNETDVRSTPSIAGRKIYGDCSNYALHCSTPQCAYCGTEEHCTPVECDCTYICYTGTMTLKEAVPSQNGDVISTYRSIGGYYGHIQWQGTGVQPIEKAEAFHGDLFRGAGDLVIPEMFSETDTKPTPRIAGRKIYGNCSNIALYCSAHQCSHCEVGEHCTPVECDCTYICYTGTMTLIEAVPSQNVDVVSTYKNDGGHYGHTQWQEPGSEPKEKTETFHGDLFRGAGDLVIPEISNDTDTRPTTKIVGRKIYGNCSNNALYCSALQCAYCKIGEQCTPVECDCTYICYQTMTIQEAVPRKDGNVISTYRNIGGHYGHTQWQEPGSQRIENAGFFYGDLFRGSDNLVIPDIYSETDTRPAPTISGRRVYGDCSANTLYCSVPQCDYCGMGEKCSPVECHCTYICYAEDMTLEEAVPRQNESIQSDYTGHDGHYGHTQWQDVIPIVVKDTFHGDLLRGAGDALIPEIYNETDTRVVQTVAGRSVYGNCSTNMLYCSVPHCVYCGMGEQCAPVECPCTYICYADSMTLEEAVPRQNESVQSEYIDNDGHHGHTQWQMAQEQPTQTASKVLQDLIRGEGDLIIPEFAKEKSAVYFATVEGRRVYGDCSNNIRFCSARQCDKCVDGDHCSPVECDCTYICYARNMTLQEAIPHQDESAKSQYKNTDRHHGHTRWQIPQIKIIEVPSNDDFIEN